MTPSTNDLIAATARMVHTITSTDDAIAECEPIVDALAHLAPIMTDADKITFYALVAQAPPPARRLLDNAMIDNL